MVVIPFKEYTLRKKLKKTKSRKWQWRYWPSLEGQKPELEDSILTDSKENSVRFTNTMFSEVADCRQGAVLTDPDISKMSISPWQKEYYFCVSKTDTMTQQGETRKVEIGVLISLANVWLILFKIGLKSRRLFSRPNSWSCSLQFPPCVTHFRAPRVWSLFKSKLLNHFFFLILVLPQKYIYWQLRA